MKRIFKKIIRFFLIMLALSLLFISLFCEDNPTVPVISSSPRFGDAALLVHSTYPDELTRIDTDTAAGIFKYIRTVSKTQRNDSNATLEVILNRTLLIYEMVYKGDYIEFFRQVGFVSEYPSERRISQVRAGQSFLYIVEIRDLNFDKSKAYVYTNGFDAAEENAAKVSSSVKLENFGVLYEP